MDKREIITLMHKLFYGRLGPSAKWTGVFTDNEKLDRLKFDTLVQSFFGDSTILIYESSLNVNECHSSQGFEYVSNYIKSGVVKIANPMFTKVIEVDPLGVAGTYCTNENRC